MKQVFLHIGLHKTGSTSLQYFLSRNRKKLASLGYFYPFTQEAQHNLAWLLGGDSRADCNSETWEHLEESLLANNFNKIIVSSECFVEFQRDIFIQKVANKLKKYNTKIIVYIRRQDKRIESLFTQQIKSGNYTGTPQDYLNRVLINDGFNYLNLLQKWSNYFGQENIIVRPLEKLQIQNICYDFLKIIGIAGNSDFVNTPDRNIKPNLAQIRALYFLNNLVAKKNNLEGEGFHKLNLHPKIRFLENYCSPLINYTSHWKSPKDYNLLPYEDAIKIMEKSEESNNKIARKILGRQDGILFYQQLSPYTHDNLELENLGKKQLIDLCTFLLENRLEMENKL